jgi:hypothetical protein
MLMISSRAVPLLDIQSHAAGEVREALFRDDTGRFLLYLGDRGPSPTVEERVIILGARKALIWLHAPAQEERSLGVSATGKRNIRRPGASFMFIHVVADSSSRLAGLRAALEPKFDVTSELLGGASISRSECTALVVKADLRIVENIAAPRKRRIASPVRRGSPCIPISDSL